MSQCKLLAFAELFSFICGWEKKKKEKIINPSYWPARKKRKLKDIVNSTKLDIHWEKAMAPHSSTPSMGSLRVGHG